jgi:glycine/D-amino acid oxidase-like deaminating enzyme
VIEHPYWWDTRAPAALDRAELPRSVDVAVVGAGYTGLVASRQLAQAGASVVVFEREEIGWGGSSRNGGQVLTGFKLEPAALIARYGSHRARELFYTSLTSIAELERLIADEAIDCEYARTGYVQAASKPSHFEAFRDEQALLAREFGHRVELVPKADQRSELGTDRYHGLLVDEMGGALNPAKYVYGLANAASRAGVVIARRTAVNRLSRPSTRWSVETSRGVVDAGDVLVATDAYTDEAVPWLQRRLVPIGSYVIVTEPLAQADVAALIPRRRMVFDSKNFLVYFRVLADGRLLFGGRAEFGRPDEDATRRAAAILRDNVSQVFPQLASVRVDYAWCGTVAFTRDQMPHAGRIDGAYYACGYCGHGVAMATYLGALIGRRMAGEPIEHPLFDDRFAPIPCYTGKPWFLPFLGAYYRFKDMVG